MVVTSTSPIVVVANRLPFVITKDADGNYCRKHSAGGLVTAVAPVVVETGGLWVGWPGTGGAVPIPEAGPGDVGPTAGLRSDQVLAVDVEPAQFDDYYNGCCNACFWPLFHSMPDRAIFEQEKWEAYIAVNEQFAKLTIEAVKRSYKKQPDAVPLVWIHDYHLMYAANYIRTTCDAQGIDIKMAFFLHIPFPSWDIVRLFPWVDQLLQGILGCDSIGFHLEDYCLNFIDCCQRNLGCRVDRERMLVEHNKRTVSVNTLPISIPYERFRNMAREAPIIVKNKSDGQMMLGVDRLDYTKGIINRIEAFELLLEKYPEHIEKVYLLQVAVPSRTDVKEYKELKESLDKLIGRINGRFTTPNWSPIRYIYGSVTHAQLAGFYRDASVALVTPLRDGMNLVAKEFVACQTNDPGVLVLSPFAGAGVTMQEALMVNPYEKNSFAQVMHRALTLPEDEREMRMKQLSRREKQRDVNFWLRQVLRSVECLGDDDSAQDQMGPLSEDDIDYYLSNYVTESSRLALILDYDGTLAPIAPHPDIAYLPRETKQVLERLSHMPDVDIAIISGRSLENVKKMVGIEGITYAGNHGFEILHTDGSMFVHPVPHDYIRQLNILRAALPEVCKTGACVEDKGVGLTLHYRNVAMADRDDVVSAAIKLFNSAGIPVHKSHMSLEAIPPVTWDSGRATIYILRTLFGLDWCDRISTIFAGDDDEDEHAMIALKGMAITFRITDYQNTKTSADYRLPNTDSVLTMLRWIEKRLGARAPKPYVGLGAKTTRSRTPSASDYYKAPKSGHSPPARMMSNMTVEDYETVLGRAGSVSPMPDES